MKMSNSEILNELEFIENFFKKHGHYESKTLLDALEIRRQNLMRIWKKFYVEESQTLSLADLTEEDKKTHLAFFYRLRLDLK